MTTRDCPLQTCVNSAQGVPSDCSIHADATRHNVLVAMLATSDAHAFVRRSAARAAAARFRSCCARCVVVKDGLMSAQIVADLHLSILCPWATWMDDLYRNSMRACPHRNRDNCRRSP